MTHVLRCGDLMPGCDFEARAESEEKLLEEAEAHARTAHGVEVTPELAEKVKEAIRLE